MRLADLPDSDVTESAAGEVRLRGIALAALADLVGGPDLQARWPDSPVGQLMAAAHAHFGADWPQHLDGALEAPAAADAPLVDAIRRARVTTAEALALVIAVGAELDQAFGRAIGWLQGVEGAARPTLGLLAAVAAPLVGDEDAACVALQCGTAVQAQLLEFDGPSDAPLALAVARVPPMLLKTLTDVTVLAVPMRRELAALPLDAAQRGAAENAARALAACPGALVIRVLDRDEALASAEVIGRVLGRQIHRIPEPKWPSGLAGASLTAARLPVFDLQLGPGERIDLALPPPDVPMLILLGPDGAVSVGGTFVPELSLALPPPESRSARWRQHGIDGEAALQLGRRLRCGFAQIDALARSAQHYAARRGGSADEGAVELASDAQAAASFAPIGRVLRGRVSDDALVLAPATRDELARLAARCRVREALPPAPGDVASCAVRALFAGPSGTGKTLAARWLATQLGLPLVVVDLAAVTSKWVGETEKNLAQVFARAEASSAILLFDEADSLFGARTDVGSANDRFANNQTNYLLARIETFEGIVVLTSNARQRLDAAFARRLDAVIEFHVPGPVERRALWQLHLNDSGMSTAEIDRFSALIDLPGGHVRTAVAAARAVALAEVRGVTMRDVACGLRAEYTKLGRVPPAELLG